MYKVVVGMAQEPVTSNIVNLELKAVVIRNIMGILVEHSVDSDHRQEGIGCGGLSGKTSCRHSNARRTF